MLKTYSRRLLSPYSGQVQIAETSEARALSLDGKNWEIQYQIPGSKAPPGIQNSGKQVYQYARIASVKDTEVIRHTRHHLLDATGVATAIDQLSVHVVQTSVPFSASDVFEYWLLDASDQKPLALIAASIDAEEKTITRVKNMWMAMPASQLDIKDTASSSAQYVAPVNYRLQKLIEQRAGKHPRGAWFERSVSETQEFPPCLIREDWNFKEERLLCQSYIDRLAPRLLMLQGLPHDERKRLEQATKEHALEVDEFYKLYPQVIDQELMNALLVEANMRRVLTTES